MDKVVVFDKYYRPIYEGDYVITKHGRVCKVVWHRSESHIGYDLRPVAFTNYPAPDEYDLWHGGNLIKVYNFNPDEIEKIIETEGIK